MKAPTHVELVWEHDLVFGGRSGAASITLDSAGQAGPSPVQALAFSLAGLHGYGRRAHPDERPARSPRAGDCAGRRTRAREPSPRHGGRRRFTLTGSVPDGQVQRAIDLSHEKYCSVWHSLREDITLTTHFTVAPPA